MGRRLGRAAGICLVALEYGEKDQHRDKRAGGQEPGAARGPRRGFMDSLRLCLHGRELREVVVHRLFRIDADLARVGSDEPAAIRFRWNGAQIVLFDGHDDARLDAGSLRERRDGQPERFAR